MKRSKNKPSIVTLYIIFVIILILSMVFGILAGATKISFSDLLNAILHAQKDNVTANIIWYVRIPRVLASTICGAALAVSGAVIQTVLANRLASPSIIGVNAGAGLAVTICTALGVAGGLMVSVFSFVGAFVTVLIVSFVAKKWQVSRGTVILMGVTMNSLLGACSDSICVFVPEVSILRNNFRIGDFSSATYPKTIPATIIIIISIFVIRTLSNELEILSLGEESARSLGLNTSRMRNIFLIFAAALAGTAVSVAGLLSFVGLLVPNAVRKISTNEARHLILLCALLGGGFVTLCDTLSRVIFAPYELPVGIIISFLGGPFFLYILIKGKGGHSNA